MSLVQKTHRIVGNETRIKIGNGDFLVRTDAGWQAQNNPFKKPIPHLRDARRAYKDQNRGA